MSGKSVTMRAIFINCFLFQAGFFVFASGANLPLFEQLTFLEEARHDAEQGISSFASEVMQLQHHIDLYKDRFVLLGLDEFARSTNPDEGTALVQAVTSYFNQLRGFTIIATHYDDVAEEAKRHYRVRGFSHVDEQVTQELALSNEPLLKLQKYMDYRLDLVLSKEQIPKEARLICRTFRLEPEILSYMEKKITKENM
ncbi:Endonuclease MutS2 [bioreactor metagenome]|uniref:Endonuclease MutS2 n=1 Tax=bioreactor metagenome TaxID=1076179 RepID=A0A645CJJ2_9ZZZZ